MPGPPVARVMLMSRWAMRYWEPSTVGLSIHPMIPSGAPAFTAASWISFAAITVHFFARGWGEKMMPFFVFRARRALKMAVEVGFVVGMIPASTPMGSAMRK